MGNGQFSKQGCLERGAEGKALIGQQRCKRPKEDKPKKKMNYLRKLPWICARGSEGGNCGSVQGAGVPGSAVADGFLEAASTYSSAGAEAAGHGLHISCSPLDEKCSTFLEEE